MLCTKMFTKLCFYQNVNAPLKFLGFNEVYSRICSYHYKNIKRLIQEIKKWLSKFIDATCILYTNFKIV